MTSHEVDVTRNGAVLLGPEVVCDGFHCKRSVRIQSHVHEDHLVDFDRSKGHQDIYLSP